MHSILCIASSESAGLAGLAVDLRTAAALGVHAAPALAAVTSQPVGHPAAVSSLHRASLEQQIGVALARIRPAAVKIGLLAGSSASHAVVAALRDFRGPLVVDPVASNAAGSLWPAEEYRAGILALLPLAPILTPNLPELAALAQRELGEGEAELRVACEPLLAGGAKAVLVKGGHRKDDADDLLVTASASRRYLGERLPGEFRGTGCVLSTAIAAYLARGRDLETAIELAREFLRSAMAEAFEVADGSRLPHVFFEFYGREGLP